MQECDIKEALKKELEATHPDVKRIAELTDSLLDLATDSIRFSVDAHHINRLGLELVAKQETALSELIKNAYDADATKVEVTFKNHDEPGGQLTIRDNGSGMSAEVIKQTWMRISTNDKEKNPISFLYRRSKAGKKGIGRFAVQRLGTKLTLETEVEGSNEGIRVIFDWDG